MCYTEDELADFSIKRFMNSIRQMLRRALPKGVTIIAMVDVVYDAYDKVWQFHLHGIVFGIDMRTLQKAMKKAFSSSAAIYRPVVIQDICDPEEQLSYMFKTFWTRKEKYLANSGRLHSASLPLKGPQLRSLLAFWSRYAIRDLVFLFGARRNPDGYFRLLSTTRNQTNGSNHV